jgi:hypothetical protein
MLGRALFALVCLIIAAGLLLPVYPAEVDTPRSADARDIVIADTAAPGCGVCGPAAVASGSGPCERALPAAAAAPKDCLNLTVYLILRPLPKAGQAGDPQLLAPKLKTI